MAAALLDTCQNECTRAVCYPLTEDLQAECVRVDLNDICPPTRVNNSCDLYMKLNYQRSYLTYVLVTRPSNSYLPDFLDSVGTELIANLETQLNSVWLFFMSLLSSTCLSSCACRLPPPADPELLTPEMTRDICLQRALDTTFKTISSDKEFSYVYFGSLSGVFRAFPGRVRVLEPRT